MISKRNILNFETRRKIYEFVENNPGLHFSEISRRIGIPRTTLFHHIRVLEKQDLVELRCKREYKYIYPKNDLGAQEKEILELL
jgi:predicted transcriptional regulator